MRLASPVALAISATLLATACGATQHAADRPAQTTQSDAPPPPSSAGGTTRFGGTNLSESAAKAFVATLTSAVQSGDEKAFLSLFDPHDRALRQQQATWFANVRRAPLALRAFHLVTASDDIDSSGRGQVAADLAFEHQFADAEPSPVAEWYDFAFRTSGGRLVATKVTGASAGGVAGEKYSRYYRQAWDDGAMTAVQGRHTILLGPEQDAAALRAAAPVADRAVEQDYAAFARVGQPVPASLQARRWVLTLGSPRVRDPFDYFGGSVDPKEAAFAGVTTPIYHSDLTTGFLETTHPAVTSRITLAREVVPSMGQADGEFASVTRHEVAHAIAEEWLTSGAVDQPETWVVEGLAQWIEDDGAPLSSADRAAAAATLRGKQSLPPGDVFYDGDDATVHGHYESAHAAVRFLVQSRGPVAAFRVLRQLYTETAGLTSFSRALGMDEEQFVGKVKGSIGG